MAQALVSNIDSSKVAAACVLVLRFIYATLDVHKCFLFVVYFVSCNVYTYCTYVRVCVCYILYVCVYSLF